MKPPWYYFPFLVGFVAFGMWLAIQALLKANHTDQERQQVDKAWSGRCRRHDECWQWLKLCYANKHLTSECIPDGEELFP